MPAAGTAPSGRETGRRPARAPAIAARSSRLAAAQQLLAALRQGNTRVGGGGIDAEYAHAVNSSRFGRRVLATSLALAVLVAGCGGGDEDAGTSVGTAQDQAETSTVQPQKGISQAEQQGEKRQQEEQQSGGY